MTYKDLMESPELSPVDVKLWYNSLSTQERDEEYSRIVCSVAATDAIPFAEKGDAYKRNKEIVRVLDSLRATEERSPAKGGANPVADFLKSPKGKKVLEALERIEGYKGRKVLDKTQTPWKVSAVMNWAYVARQVTDIFEIGTKRTGETLNVDWEAWANYIGLSAKKLKYAYCDYRKLEEKPDVYSKIEFELRKIIN